jgi:ABC-type transporter Mla subunit MlaD
MARQPTRAGGSRLSQGVSKLTARLDRRTTLIGLVVLAIGMFLAYVAFQATTGPPFAARYQVKVSVPSDAPTLRVGQAVRVGGQLAGLISAVEPDRQTGGSTITANITKAPFRPMPEDTTAYVRVHSIVYESWLELRPGTSDRDLASGAELKTPATFGTDLLQVVKLFDQKTREELSQTAVNSGFGVAGRGVELNQALNDLPLLARNLSSQLRAATAQPGALADLISGAAQTFRGLRGNLPDDVSGLIDSADATFAVLAARSDDLRASIRLLGPFESQVLSTGPVAESVLTDLASVSRDLEPAVREINDDLPVINHLFGQGHTLREQTRRITKVADPTLEAARPVVFDLFPVLTVLEPLNKNLAKLKATVEPYKPEIAQAGKRLADATGVRYPEGLAPGAPAGRVLPVLTPRPCVNPIPKPGKAQKDSC